MTITLTDLIRAKNGRRRPVQHESLEQQDLVAYARSKWPEVPIVCATRGKQLSGRTKWARVHQARRIKREGYEKGTADLFFSSPRKHYHGLYIEMKDTGETQCSVTPEQRAFGARVMAQGYCWTACFGSAHAREVLDWYFEKEARNT